MPTAGFLNDVGLESGREAVHYELERASVGARHLEFVTVPVPIRVGIFSQDCRRKASARGIRTLREIVNLPETNKDFGQSHASDSKDL